MRRLWRTMVVVQAALFGGACGVSDSNAPTPVE